MYKERVATIARLIGAVLRKLSTFTEVDIFSMKAIVPPCENFHICARVDGACVCDCYRAYMHTERVATIAKLIGAGVEKLLREVHPSLKNALKGILIVLVISARLFVIVEWCCLCFLNTLLYVMNV